MRKTKVATNNREIYNKLNILNFSQKVSLQNIKQEQVTKIINNINRNQQKVIMEIAGKTIILKKINPLNLELYLNKR